MDSGVSDEQLMQMALDAALGGLGDSSALVELLYSNAVGAPPPQQELDHFVGLIENDTYTEVGLAMMAADHPLNEANIDLVGLSDTGLDYVF